MKVVAICGSPRKEGSTAKLLDAFADAAKKSGADVLCFQLNDLTFSGCQSCVLACKQKMDHCRLDDGLTPVLKAIADADVVAVGTPVYMSDVTSQTKAFIDRTFSFFKPDFKTNPEPSRLAGGKTLVLVVTQGAPVEQAFKDVVDRYSAVLSRSCACKDVHVVRGLNLPPVGDAGAALEPAMAQISDVAAKIFK